MTKKLEYIWLSRDKGDRKSHVDVWLHEPTFLRQQWKTDYYWDDLAVIEYKNARRIFGITLRPGQCKRIKIEVKE